MNTKPSKIVLLSLVSIVSLLSMFFIAVELINIFTTNFFVFLHPFNGLVRYSSRLITFLYILLSLDLSIINIFKPTPVKTALSKVTIVTCFLLSYTFLFYLDFFMFLILNITLSACVFFTFFIYWYIPNRREIKKILTKNNQ